MLGLKFGMVLCLWCVFECGVDFLTIFQFCMFEIETNEIGELGKQTRVSNNRKW